MKNKIVITNDGSHSIYNPEINECYHSKHGSILEAEHVFIRNGFLASNKKELNILEVGFGTGLNALLTAQQAINKKVNTNYHTIELYPIKEEEYKQLNFAELIGVSNSNLIDLHTCNWETQEQINSHFNITKIKTALEDFDTTTKYNIIYFDAFSPEKQPHLWTDSIFKKMHTLLKDDGFLVTYCAKGVVKRTLKAVGFKVVALDGPPGKRQMTRAEKQI